MGQAIAWFEIPAEDLERARGFYESILAMKMDPMPGMEGMYSFPADPDGVGGAIITGEDYEPGATGTLVYLDAGPSLKVVTGRVEAAGGKIHQAQVDIGQFGYIAMITDTEGNRVGLHSDGV